MSFIDKYLVRLSAKKIAKDEYGNSYYLGRRKDYLGRNKRYVIYNGLNESSKVPPMWHAWLHYMIDDIPTTEEDFKWQQDPRPNLSGTKYAYNPEVSEGKKIHLFNKWTPKV